MSPSWSRQLRAALLVVLTVLLTGCATVPEEAAPKIMSESGAKAEGAIPQPDPKAGSDDLLRGFISDAGNPAAAKSYLTDSARPDWQGDSPPTIIDDDYSVTPLPAGERKVQGDDPSQATEVTLVLTVTFIGRLGQDRAYIPANDTVAYQVVERRTAVGAPWRIEVPPTVVLISHSDFIKSYQKMTLYFFDPEGHVLVPDLRWVPAEPFSGIPGWVVKLLLAGPADSLVGAVRSMLTPDTTMSTNAVVDPDSKALVVNLTNLGDRNTDQREQIAAQIVLSLRGAGQGRIRLLVDGHPLLSGHTDWQTSDIPSYDEQTKLSAELSGMFTTGGKVYSLRDGTPIPGQASNGEISVADAAQSLDGKLLAVVQDLGVGRGLRIGPLAGPFAEVELRASNLTRPTWLVGSSIDAMSNEVWTVSNGLDVLRVVRAASGAWVHSPVNASELRTYGTISELRLSRDGVRLAAVVSGRVVVASVIRTRDSVTVGPPRVLPNLTGVVGVDWLAQDTVTVATGQTGRLVVNIPVDGFNPQSYNNANIKVPIRGIAAGPNRDIVVSDRAGLWVASGVKQLWRLLPEPEFPNARPFYPG